MSLWQLTRKNAPRRFRSFNIDREHLMRKQFLCAIGAVLITAIWSIGTVNAVSEHRQIYVHASGAI